VGALFEKAGVVAHAPRVGGAQVVRHLDAQPIAQDLWGPLGPAQQGLHITTGEEV
jgi:hypothetical protein